MPVLSLHPGIFFQDRFYPAQVGTQFRAFTGLRQPVPVSSKPHSDRLWQMLSNGFELTSTRPRRSSVWNLFRKKPQIALIREGKAECVQ